MRRMLLEFSKLAVGLLIALFHRPLADYIVERERMLAVLLRSRGIFAPVPITRAAAYNVYFILGIFVATFQAGRIWWLTQL
jgi:hypothetical protein